MRRLLGGLALVFAATTVGAAVPPATTPLGFANANVPWRFAFPRDHAAHDRFASEWWYYTGHLRARDGRRFGYELTFFRIGLRPGRVAAAPGRSRWRGNQLYPAHFALTDERGKSFFFAERFARDALGAGFASTQRLEVRADAWGLAGTSPFRMHAEAGEVALELEQRTEKPPAIHGHDGISKKASCATCASHYYSMTRLRTQGVVVLRGERFAVDGISWMDHEFGSSQLQADQTGWDWFSIQLDDRRELMLYLLRRKDGTPVPESSGSLIDRDGRVHYLSRSGFSVAATGTWTSPHTRGTYPSGWRVRVPSAGVDVVLVPVLADQELANTVGGVSYWEGAVDVTDAASGRPLGAGYVELTGYAGAVPL
jgi:predicted secreted hydrolase